jgi:hypothetical protein
MKKMRKGESGAEIVNTIASSVCIVWGFHMQVGAEKLGDAHSVHKVYSLPIPKTPSGQKNRLLNLLRIIIADPG